MGLPELDITAFIAGRPYARSHVQAWEDRRIDAALISGRRRRCAIELSVPGAARQFIDWFTEITFSSDEDAMSVLAPITSC